MTLAMPDSIIPANLPPGYGQYLAYADGRWPTAAEVRRLYPRARVVALTVNGSTLEADGIDCEEGDVDAAGAAGWIARKLAAEPASRPVAYADLATEGYSMSEVLGHLRDRGIARQRVRVLAAHYGAEHVCSAANGCRDASGELVTWEADGTQWTEAFPGAGGSQVDMSVLNDDFFGTVSNVDEIPLDILGSYTNNAGDLFVIGTDLDGVLHESKRTAPGKWTAPYPIAGKVGA